MSQGISTVIGRSRVLTESFRKSDVVSTWIKSMRFNDYEEAAYWFIVLSENDLPEKYLAQKLAVFASEDCFDPHLIVLANSVHQMYESGLGNANMLWQVMYRCCNARKFWESPDGQEYELVSNKAQSRYKRNGIEPTPRWAIDRHTKRYYELVEAGKQDETDRRFSGDMLGRLHMVKMFQKYGKLSPNIEDNELWEEAQRELADIEN